MTTSVNILPTNLRLIFKFTNLTSLNISNTDIKNHCLDFLIDSLEKLCTLDLSLCRLLTSFNSLIKLSLKLKWLNLYNCSIHLQQNPTIYQILYQLKSLEYLDISTDYNTHSISANEYDVNKFLSEENCLINLKYLDLSGQKNILSKSLYNFLLSHTNLQFLGLFLTDEKYSKCLFDTSDVCYSKTRQYTYDLHEIISLINTEDDFFFYEPCLIESLKRYNERAYFVQKILYHIFFLTRSYQSKNQNLLIELILHTMSIHTNLQTVQMASTACIYNLTRTPLTEQINVKCLAKIVQAITNVMELFPNQQQVNERKSFQFRIKGIYACFSYKKIVF
jgi:Zyg-11 family protein